MLSRARYLIAKGHEVYSIYFASKNMGAHASIDWAGSVEIGRVGILFVKYCNRFLFPYRISQFTKEYDIDIFHVHGMLSSFYFPFSRAKKLVIENQGSDVIRTADRFPIFKPVYRYYYRFVDGVVQDSKVAQKKGLNLGAPSVLNEIIEIGVDFRDFNPDVEYGKSRINLGLSKKDKIVFCSRGITDLYNLDIIIKAIPIVVKSIKKAKFVFASNLSSFFKKYSQLIHDLKIEDHLVITGEIDHVSEMPFYCKDSDVMVSVPSSDSSPASVYEAMACKTPVIISEIPWYRGKFEKDKELMVVPVRDEIKLAQAIIEILTGVKKVDLDSAFNKVFEEINFEIENRKLEKFYERILAFS